MVQTFFQTTMVSQQKLLNARLVLSLVTLLFQPPYSTFCNSPLCFTSSHSVLLLHIFLCRPSCLLASFLPLHLYYPLNNSLCIESVLFVPNPLKVWALKHRLPAGLVFSCKCPIPLFVFCHFSAFRRSCYRLFCGTMWDYSHPKFELLPNDMCHACLLPMCISDYLYPFLPLTFCWWQ